MLKLLDSGMLLIHYWIFLECDVLRLCDDTLFTLCIEYYRVCYILHVYSYIREIINVGGNKEKNTLMHEHFNVHIHE